VNDLNRGFCASATFTEGVLTQAGARLAMHAIRPARPAPPLFPLVFQDESNGNCAVITGSCASDVVSYCFSSSSSMFNRTGTIKFQFPCIVVIESTQDDPNLFKAELNSCGASGTSAIIELKVTRGDPIEHHRIFDVKIDDSTCAPCDAP
jgi:hypothetical protein